MRLRTRLLLLMAGPVMYAVSCSSPNAPADQGGIVFRFEPATDAARLSRTGGVAGAFDSLAVRVFRPGTPITLEVAQGALIKDGLLEMTIPCRAESNKRVSVELFIGGVMEYHGVNEDVDVTTGRRTDVLVDAYPFRVPSVSVTPGVVPDGASFDLVWPSTVGARTYTVQASTSAGFATIEWSQSLTDTTVSTALPAGAHYFRVAPATPFATGTYAGPEECYVLGGSGDVIVTGFSAPGVIPGDVVSVYGENLDYPGTQVMIDSQPMEIVTTAWDELAVRMPRAATTDVVDVMSGLGDTSSPKELVALRVAYVTDGGTFAEGYTTILANHRDDFGNSGVATVPVEELDWRDMNVFDIILVGHDTGVIREDWGGGQPGRAAAIISSRANVLAMGKGGAVFLEIASARADVPQRTIADNGVYYVPDTDAEIFTTPHSVTGKELAFAQGPVTTVALEITSQPVDVNLYASSDKITTCILTLCSDEPNNRWVLADFRLNNTGGTPVIYFFWGHAGDPGLLTVRGTNCLGNIMYLLYDSLAPATP